MMTRRINYSRVALEGVKTLNRLDGYVEFTSLEVGLAVTRMLAGSIA